ncbi:hypothetical protein C8R44DRAFT_874497 [Mycena epipterygia]|nr:hypothetical protein C8R44DRAFT_874497 [Mycena epipterygia]
MSNFIPHTALPVLPPRPTTTVIRMRWVLIHFMRHSIKYTMTSSAKVKSAWLYPDGDIINQRMWVRVPCVHGVKRACTVEDMETEKWIDCARGASTNATDYGRLSLTVHRFPFDEPVDLEYSFTIVVASQRFEGPNVYPVNDIINAMVPGLTRPWRGNVLVFKHGKTAAKPIINIQDEDTTFVKILLKRVLRDGLVG